MKRVILSLILLSTLLLGENSNTYLDRAVARDAQNDTLGASSDFDRAIALDPNNVDAYLQRGKFNLKEGYQFAALEDFDKAALLASQNPRVYYERAHYHMAQNDPIKALKDLSRAISLAPDKPEAYGFRGVLYAQRNQLKKALSDYRNALKLNPKDYHTYYNRALLWHKRDDITQYCSDLKNSLKYSPQNNPQKDQIIKRIQNYCDESQSSYYYQRGISFFNQKQYQKAIDIYTKGLKKEATNPIILSLRGNAYRQLKRYTEALADYNSALKHQKNLIKEIFLISIYYGQAKANLMLNHPAKALKAIDQSMAILLKQPEKNHLGNEIYYYVRGASLLKLNRIPEAIKMFDHTLSINPNDPLALINRASAKLMLKSKPEDLSNIFAAIRDCNKAILIDSKSGRSYFIRGKAKSLLPIKNHCGDLKRAKKLGYPVPTSTLDGC